MLFRSIENAAIKHIEGEARIKAMQQRIKQQKTEILTALNMDELFSKVLNLASQ